MAPTYDVIDADGDVLELFSLWEEYNPATVSAGRG